MSTPRRKTNVGEAFKLGPVEMAAPEPAGVVLEMPAPPLTFSFRMRAALQLAPRDPGPQGATELFAAVLSCPALGSRALPQNTRSKVQKRRAPKEVHNGPKIDFSGL